MIISASALAGVVVAAVGDTLVAPSLAEEERQGLRVFGDVGAYTVSADAGVGQAVRIAAILDSAAGVRWWLQADQLVYC